MDRSLEIVLKFVTAQAEQQSRSWHDGEKARAKDSATEQLKQMLAVEDVRKQIARQKAAAEEQAVKQRAVAEEQAARERTSIVEKEMRDQDLIIAQAKRSLAAVDKIDAERKRKLAQETAAFEASVQRAVVAGIYQVADAWKQVEDRTTAAANAALDYEKRTRKLAALMGMTPEKATPEVARFVATTGLSADEADQFIQQFRGTIEAGLTKRNITEPIAKELMQSVGRWGAQLGGDQATRGELAGILAQFGPIKTAQEGLAQMEAIRQALTAGRGEDTPLTRELLATSGSMVREGGGGIRNIVEQAALIGVTSLSGGPARAGERAEQLARFARGTTPQQIRKLRERFGVTEQMGLEERLNMIMPQLQQIGQTRDVQTFLTEEGLANEETGRAAVEFMGNFGVFQERMRLARQSMMPGGGAAVERKTQAAEQTPLGQQMLAEGRGFAVKAMRGRADRAALALVQRTQAEQLARKEDLDLWTTLGDKFRGVASGDLWTMGETGARVRAESETMQNLTRQAFAVGVDPQKVLQLTSPTYGRIIPDLRPRISRMGDLMREIEAKGGKPSEAVGQGASSALLGIPGQGAGGGVVTDPDNAALMREQNSLISRLVQLFDPFGGAGYAVYGSGGMTGSIAPSPPGPGGTPSRPMR